MSVQSNSHFVLIRLALLVSMGLCTIATAHAIGTDSDIDIVAKVKDTPITSSDLDQRTRLAILSSNINPSPEIMPELRQQVLRTLVDERLRWLEMKRREVPVEQSEIDDEFNNIARQNGMSADQFKKVLESKGISVGTIYDQIKTDVAWGKYIQSTQGPKVIVTEQDIDFAYQQAVELANEPRYLLSEIYLDIPAPQQASEVYKSAQSLRSQIAKGGSFPLIAQQFSQSVSAAQGGDIGWAASGDLDEDVAVAVKKMSRGQISQPIRTRNSYVIVALRDRFIPGQGDPMNSTISFRQLFLSFPETNSETQIKKDFESGMKIRDEIKGCGSLDALSKKYNNATAVEAASYKVKDMPSHVQQVLYDVGTGQVSLPLRSAGGIHLFVVCSRKDEKTEVRLPTREEIANRLYYEGLSSKARNITEELRARAGASIEYTK